MRGPSCDSSRLAVVCGEPVPGSHALHPRDKEESGMPSATELGQAGLQGWREKVADGISGPVAERSPLDEDQVRAAIGAVFFVLSVLYVFKTLSAARR